MRNVILLSLFFYGQAFGLDLQMHQADLDYLDQNFMIEELRIPSKAKSENTNKIETKNLSSLQIMDLETKYFDQVSTKKAAAQKMAPSKKLKRKRSR
jgi:hypothetical protein